MKKFLFTVFLLLPVLAFGAEQAVITIADWTGGLNTRDGTGGVADNEITKSSNCYLLANGIAKRNGYVEYNDSARVDTANEGTGIIYAPFTDSTQIVATAGTKIGKKVADAWSDITGNVTLTADKIMLFTMANNNLVGCNGTDAAWYWDGTGNATTLSGTNIPTTPTSCETFHGRLFLSQGRGVYWSEYLGNWKTFNPNDYQLFEENVTGMWVYGSSNNSRLIIFTANSIHSCTFDPTISTTIGGRGIFRFDTISAKHGCISPHSIQECTSEDGQLVLVWADNDGLKGLFGDTVLKLTDKIQPDWDNLNFSVLDESSGIHYKQKRWYMLFCASGTATTHNRVIVYDLRNWVVSGIFDWAISGAGIIRVDGEDLLIGSDYSGYWHQYDSGSTDGGAAISAYFETKSYDGEMPWNEKGFQSIGVHHSYLGAYDLDITMKYDYGNKTYGTTYTATQVGVPLGSFVLGVDILSGTGGLVIFAKRLRGRGRNALVRIANADTLGAFQIYQVGFLYEPGNIITGR